MATDFDPYRILQISPDASEQEVHASFARLSESAGNGDGATIDLRAVETAFHILADPEQRRAYDERHAEALARGYIEPVEVMYASVPCGKCGSMVGSSQRFCTSCGAESTGATGKSGVPWGYLDIVKAIVVLVGGLIVTGIPIYLIADALAGDSAIEDDPNAWALVLVSNFAVQFLMLGSAYWFSVRKYRLNFSALGWRKPKRGGILFAIGLILGAFGIVMAWGLVLQLLGVTPDTDLPDQTYEDPRPIVALVVLSIVLAPLAEETFFRGFVFGALYPRWGFVLGAIASGALFSVAHIGNTGYLPVLPSIVGIGVLFAWGYYWSGSLYPSIGAHLAFNSFSVAYSIAAA
jgi:membrane protease YdiL (CAAX protease family)